MKPTVLIADGDAELCDLYQQFLTASGYEVETASNGLDCLENLRRALPGVLVLDPELRWGGGEGVLAWLREESPEIPVILTASVGYPQELAESNDSSEVDRLPKPFTLAALLEKVRAAFANGRRAWRKLGDVSQPANPIIRLCQQ